MCSLVSQKTNVTNVKPKFLYFFLVYLTALSVVQRYMIG
jgi:hypothetical protein